MLYHALPVFYLPWNGGMLLCVTSALFLHMPYIYLPFLLFHCAEFCSCLIQIIHLVLYLHRLLLCCAFYVTLFLYLYCNATYSFVIYFVLHAITEFLPSCYLYTYIIYISTCSTVYYLPCCFACMLAVMPTRFLGRCRWRCPTSSPLPGADLTVGMLVYAAVQ
jgi:hypothetical protein